MVHARIGGGIALYSANRGGSITLYSIFFTDVGICDLLRASPEE